MHISGLFFFLPSLLTVWEQVEASNFRSVFKKDLKAGVSHAMKSSIDEPLSRRRRRSGGGACLGLGIIIHLWAQQLTRMSKVNTRVRGHGSTDRHDEWPEVPTRRHTHKLARGGEEGDVWSAPPHHRSTENPIHTLH